VPGDQDALAQGGQDLHGGDAGAGGGAGHSLNGEGGDAGQLQHAGQLVIVEEHGVEPVDMAAPKGQDLLADMDDAPIGEIRAFRAAGDGASGIPVERAGGFYSGGREPAGGAGARYRPRWSSSKSGS
jgi:hypothetical protein